MSKTGLATRNKAMPFRANCYDSYNIGNQFPDVLPWSDLYNLSQGISSYIRLAVPASGDLVQLRLTIQALNPSASTQMRIAICRFGTDGISVDTMTAAERAISSRLITGQEALLSWAAGEPILVDGIDLLKALPKEGEPGYSRDGFVLYIGLATASTTGWKLSTFKVDGSVQMGVL